MWGEVIRDTCVPSLSYSSLLYPGWRSHCARKKRKAFEHPILNTNKQATDENTQKYRHYHKDNNKKNLNINSTKITWFFSSQSKCLIFPQKQLETFTCENNPDSPKCNYSNENFTFDTYELRR